MAQLRVDLIDMLNDRHLKLKLPNDVPLEQLVPALARKLGLPEEEYVLIVEGVEAPLMAEVTLAGAGVGEGATLLLERAAPEAPPVEAELPLPVEAPLAEPTPPPPLPTPPVAPAARRASSPGWAWAVGGVVLLAAALAVGGMWASRQAAERTAATATAEARNWQETLTAQVKATEQAIATAQARATEHAAATTTAQARAAERAAATATAQARAAEQAAATATAQAQAAERAAATATAQTQATEQAAAASTATASAQSAGEVPSHWPIVFSDSFSTDEDDWPTGEYDYDQVTLGIQITNGKYRVEAIAHQKFALWAIPPMDFISDFHLSADARQVSGPRIRALGLVFRFTDSDNYGFFGISDDQQFKVDIKYQGEWIRLVDWTGTSTIRPSEMNRLTVIAEGSHYRFFINGQQVSEIVDNLLSSGKAGYGSELDAGETAVLEFDNFELRAP